MGETNLLRVRFRCPECGEELTGHSCCDAYPATIVAFCDGCDLVVEEYDDLSNAGLVLESEPDTRKSR